MRQAAKPEVGMHARSSPIISLVACWVFMPTVLSAAAFTPGNVAVVENNIIYEYTLNGELVQSIPIEYPGGYSGAERARDLIFHGVGRIHVYNGTYQPFVSTLDLADDSWSHLTLEGWDTENFQSYGGIAVGGGHVFVTDMTIDIIPSAHGVVAFELAGETGTRFAEDVVPTDLTLGLDGQLYVLNPDGMSSSDALQVYDPVTREKIRDIDLAQGMPSSTDVRAAAADATGDLYVASWNGEIFRLDPGGNLQNTITILCDDIFPVPVGCSFTDVDLAPDGTVVLGDRWGHVWIVAADLSGYEGFLTNPFDGFVALVPATPGEARNVRVNGHDMGTGNLALSFVPACEASDHDIYYGPLDLVSTWSWSGSVCGIGTTGSFGGFHPGDASSFFVVVGNSGDQEGSYGDDSQGTPRPPYPGSGCARVQADPATSCP